MDWKTFCLRIEWSSRTPDLTELNHFPRRVNLTSNVPKDLLLALVTE